MSTIKGKITLGVLAGGVALSGLGAMFTGNDELDKASAFAVDAEERLLQFAKNEETLKYKLGLIKDKCKQQDFYC